MKFLVLWRMELSLLSREMAQAVGKMADYGTALEGDGKVLARYHVVGAHGGAWIYEVESHEEFERLLARAPVFNFARYEVYPLAEMGSSPRPGVHG
jgi:muconolactone delta-isomerase